MNFYKLVEFLHREANLLEINSSLVCLAKLKKTQTKRYQSINIDIFNLFNQYEISDISQDNFLKRCSYLIHSENYMSDE